MTEKQVLYADSHEDTAQPYIHALRSEGFRLVSHTNIRDAILYFANISWDRLKFQIIRDTKARDAIIIPDLIILNPLSDHVSHKIYPDEWVRDYLKFRLKEDTAMLKCDGFEEYRAGIAFYQIVRIGFPNKDIPAILCALSRQELEDLSRLLGINHMPVRENDKIVNLAECSPTQFTGLVQRLLKK